MKINGSIINSSAISKIKDATSFLSSSGYTPSNTYSVSIILEEQSIYPYFLDDFNDKEYEIGYEVPYLKEKFILITADDIPLRNISVFETITHKLLGIIRITHNAQRFQIMWGFADGSMPTKNIVQHLLAHNAMLRRDYEHRAIANISSPYFQQYTYTFDGDDETLFSYSLWDAMPDLARLVPDGIGLIQDVVSPSKEINELLMQKFDKYNVVARKFENVIIGGKNWDEIIGIATELERASQTATTLKDIDQFFISREYFEEMANNTGIDLNPEVLIHGNKTRKREKTVLEDEGNE